MNLYRRSNNKTNLIVWANTLTILRAIAGAQLIVTLSLNWLSISWLILLIAGFTDLADGYLARKAGGGTSWGARFDPLSDKILLTAPLIWLATKEVLPLWTIWLVISRELFVSTWRSKLKEGGEASSGGKAKTVVQFISILLMTWPPTWGNALLIASLHQIGFVLFWPSLVLAFSSALGYLRHESKSRQG